MTKMSENIRQILKLQIQASTPLDLSTIQDVRGRFIMWRQILNYESRDLSGCVFLHCYPTIPNALNINPCATKAALSPLDVGEDLKGVDLTNFNFNNLDLKGNGRESHYTIYSLSIMLANLCCLKHSSAPTR